VDRLLLTPEAAAEIIGVGRTKLYELLRVGAIESVRIGRARRVPADALHDYVTRLRTDASGYQAVYRAP
jgi:excisionase family DNA binding protein